MNKFDQNSATRFSLSPLDGRYAEKLKEVSQLFSEYQLNLTRINIELAWLKTLAEEPTVEEITPLNPNELTYLENITTSFTERDAIQLKKLETTTNHDIKAIESFLREKISNHPSLSQYKEFIHFGCTSEDINNLSYAFIIKEAKTTILKPTMINLIHKLIIMAKQYASTPMLSHTHGQPATPTTFGKEIANFVHRLSRQYNQISDAPIYGKFSGAVGNLNALKVAYPQTNWQKITRTFVENLDLQWNPYVTQIEPHDWIAEHSHIIMRFNTILLGLCKDIWSYISLGYLKQKIILGETGSSTMPHKVNPIDFENAEGNLGIANSLLSHFAEKLPISRWQRDLSDSTVMRNLGVSIGHTIVAYKSIAIGLDKIVIDPHELSLDLEKHWEVVSEAIQTVMRRLRLEEPYEQLKQLTRGQKVTQKLLHEFIKKLKIPTEMKKKLLAITPHNYIGEADQLANSIQIFLNY